MKLSKGKLPKVLRQKKQTMKKKKNRRGKRRHTKTLRKKQKPLNLHRSSVKNPCWWS